MSVQSTKGFFPLTSVSCRVAGIWPLQSDGSPRTRNSCRDHCVQLLPSILGLVLTIKDSLTDVEPGSLKKYDRISTSFFTLIMVIRIYSLLPHQCRLANILRRFLEWHNTVNFTAAGVITFSINYISIQSQLNGFIWIPTEYREYFSWTYNMIRAFFIIVFGMTIISLTIPFFSSSLWWAQKKLESFWVLRWKQIFFRSDEENTISRR